MYLLNAYPVERETERSSPIGVSGTEGEICPIPMQVLMLLVKTKVLERPACVRRRRDIVPVWIEVNSHVFDLGRGNRREERKD
jgi:hypothetical protein